MRLYRPRSVHCSITGLHRDELVARQVVAGTFDIAGQCQQLGRVPDWHGAFPADEEWRIEFSKFYYGLDLAHAYANTGDSQFLDCWSQLVTSWIDQVRPDHDPTDVAARRVQNWTYAWNLFADAGASVDSCTAMRIVESIGRQLSFIRENLAAERNHRTLELYALLIGGLAHPMLDSDGELVAFAAFELDRNLRADVLADGVHRELSTHYHAIALRSFLGARINADRFGLALAPDFDQRLGLACEFLAHVMRPDGSLPMLSDSDDGDHRGLLELAATELGRDDLRWVATQGKEGSPPLDCNRSFHHGGYHVQRSGWGNNSGDFTRQRQLIFDCGAVGESGHGHYDALHVEVFGAGRPLLVDPGRFTYSEAGDTNWRHYFKGTAAHNTVTVDGLDQVAYRRGKPKSPLSQCRLIETVDVPGVHELVGEVVSAEHDAVHRRRVLFIDSTWWVIEDTLRAHQEHRYDLRFHLTPAASNGVTVQGSVVTAPGLWLDFGEQNVRPRIEDGWIAARYGELAPAPIVSVERTETCTRFLTVVVPAEGPDEPRVTSSGAGHVELERGDWCERVTWGELGVGWQRWG